MVNAELHGSRDVGAEKRCLRQPQSYGGFSNNKPDGWH